MITADYELFSTLLKNRSGLSLTPDKVYLLQSRLLPVARKWSLNSLEELAQRLRLKDDEKLITSIAEAMTTNESSFFRDRKPFDHFRQIMLPLFTKARSTQKRIRIWSAASSSGQEAYSLAMICLEEGIKLKDWKIEIIGTDFSSEMVERAQEGIYTQFEVQRGLPAPMLIKYFTQLSTNQWQINKQARDMVQFRTGNLLKDFSFLGTMDIVFCRNVLIYFDRDDKTKVFDGVGTLLAPDGFLALGSAETVMGLTTKFKPMPDAQGLYVLQANPAAQVAASRI